VTRETFSLDWIHAAIPENAAATSTLHRHLSGPSLDPVELPAVDLGADPGRPLRTGELLGEGGMGMVHAARDEVLGRTVAVKRPRRSAGAARAIVAEARTLAGLDHPNVVPVHALGRDAEGVPVLVMKRITGQRWSDLARDGEPIERSLAILLQVCDALRFAHARGVLHRDLKPDNVMVGEFGEVYLMDWGCACLLEGATTTELVGTPAMMAPEMLRAGAALGPATDVFLLGATLHEVLLGAPRHTGANVREVVARALLAAPPVWPSGVPAELAGVIDRACAREPADRFPSVDAFAAALRAFLEHRHAVGLATRAGERLVELERAVAAGGAEAELRFAEARFGYRSALDAWADCVEARDGLARAYAVFLPWKVASGDLAGAGPLVEELREPEREHWRGRLREAQRRRTEADAALREADLGASAVARRNAVFALLTAFAGFALVVHLLVPRLGGFTPRTNFVLAFVALLVTSLAVFPFRARAFANRAARQAMGGLFVFLLSSVGNRFVAFLDGSPIAVALRADLLIGVCVYASLAVNWTRGAVLGCLTMFAGAVAVTLWPEQATSTYPMALLASLGVSLWLGWREARGGGG